MLVPMRNYSSPEYRYGFQGQEKDDEIKGSGNSLNYKFRMHDPRVARFLSIDPLYKEFPGLSTYSFAANRPIDGIDLKGLSWKPIIDKNNKILGFEWTDLAPDPANQIYALAIHINDDAFKYDFDYTTHRSNLGAAKITIYGENKRDVFVVAGTATASDPVLSGTPAEGLYPAVLGFHHQTSKKKRYLAIRVNNNGRTPAVNGYNPSNGRSYLVGYNIHKAGGGNSTRAVYQSEEYTALRLTKTGKIIKWAVSKGCTVCDINKWDEVINSFDKTSKRNNERILLKKLFASGILKPEFQKLFEMVPTNSNEVNPANYYTDDGKLHQSVLSNPIIGVGIIRNNPYKTQTEAERKNSNGETGPFPAEDYERTRVIDFPKRRNKG